MKEHDKQQCPRCGESRNVEAERVQADGDTAWHRTTCLECGCVYTEVYAFSHVEVWDEEDGLK
mgnify:CR=1 FL=1